MNDRLTKDVLKTVMAIVGIVVLCRLTAGLAAGALVLKGTQIGEYEIWGGVPAKFIKKADPAQTAEINEKIANNYEMYASWYV